jgi:hypothetical protein
LFPIYINGIPDRADPELGSFTGDFAPLARMSYPRFAVQIVPINLDNSNILHQASGLKLFSHLMPSSRKVEYPGILTGISSGMDIKAT